MILVTGASGQLGTALLRALPPGRVVTTSRRPVAGPRHVTADQADPGWADALAAGAADTEFAVLLASRITTSTSLAELAAQAELELRGPLDLLHRLPRLRHVVYASSVTVYRAGGPLAEDAPRAPANVYACVKLLAEDLLGVLAARRGIPLAILRIAQVFGPGSPPGEIIARMCAAARAGRRLEVSCGPDAFRDYVDEDDVAAAIVSAIERRADGAVNVGSGKKTTIAGLAAEIAAAAGAPAPDVTDGRPTFSMVLNVARARSWLGWEARRSPSDEIRRRLRGP